MRSSGAHRTTASVRVGFQAAVLLVITTDDGHHIDLDGMVAYTSPGPTILVPIGVPRKARSETSEAKMIMPIAFGLSHAANRPRE